MAGVHIDLGPASAALCVGAGLLVSLRVALWVARRRAVRRTRTLLDEFPHPPQA